MQKRYAHVLSAGEKADIEKAAIISLNRDDWMPYQPGKGVFLFDETLAGAFIAKAAKTHAEVYGETWVLFSLLS